MYSAAKKIEICFGLIRNIAQAIDEVVEIPEDEDKQLVFVVNFIISAVNDKLAELSQEEK